MKKITNFLIPILIVFVGFALYKYDQSKNSPPQVAEVALGDLEESSGKTPLLKAELPPIEHPAPSNGQNFLPTSQEDPVRYETYLAKLKEMSTCLNLKINPIDKNSEINFETLNQAINPYLGEVVAEYRDWTATDIKTSAGEVRRIYVEYNNNVEPPLRKVKYYSYKDGNQGDLSLTPEQSNNPSDTALASLEGDGVVFGQSLARRVSYMNGDDLLLVEKNGRIFSIELHHDGARFNCSGVDKNSNFQCTCKMDNTPQEEDGESGE